MKTLNEVKKEFEELWFMVQDPVIRHEKMWQLIQSTLTEFIEALDLREINTIKIQQREVYSPRDGAITNVYKEDDKDDGYNSCIREKKTLVDKFIGKETNGTN